MSTASLWFVTDAEFDAATEDYAVVEASVPWVRHALREDNHYLEDDCFFHDDCDDEDLKLTYKDVINNVFYYGNSLGLGADTQLLYADVDQSDEKHRDIGKRVAKEGFLEEETETSKEAREKLIDYIVHMYHSKHEKYAREAGQECDDAGKRKRAAQKLERNKGLVSPKLVDYLISLEADEDRKEVLTVLSNQHLRKIQRPVILLLAAVEKGAAEAPGSKEGWAIAYNFHNDSITIKPFHSDKDHHPLGDKWDVELPDDGICFSGHPSAFIDKVLQLEADIKEKKVEEDPVKYGCRMLVHYLVAQWIICHWKALADRPGSEAAMTNEQLEKTSDAMSVILEEAASIEHPYPKSQSTPKEPIQTFFHLQRELEDREWMIRKEAIKAKEAGNEAVAEKAAELYENLWKQLQAFNMSPENQR